MATAIDPSDVVFLDTSFAVALSAPTDQLHERARRLAAQIKSSAARIVTTRAILLEIGNALARLRYRHKAIGLLLSLEQDRGVEKIPMTDDIYGRALSLYSNRPDKEWGLIDCASFVVMTERGIAKALSADEHFLQCGFRALLREEIE